MDVTGLKGFDASTYMEHITEQTSRKATETLKDTLNNTANNNQATEEELMEACKQFEAYFLEQVFKSMMKPIDALRQSNGADTNTITDYFKEQTIAELAKTSTESQGTGLAKMLFENMKRNYNIGDTPVTSTSSVTGGESSASAGTVTEPVEVTTGTAASAGTVTEPVEEGWIPVREYSGYPEDV